MRKSITKYPFLKGTQCLKSLWLNQNQPELKSTPSEEELSIMNKGKEVGIFARQLFPDGIDVSDNETIYGKAIIEQTAKLLQTDNQVFYEAGFETLDGTKNIKVDILVRCERATKLIEVKSSTSIKVPEHILDVAFQYYVLTNSSYSGPPIQVYVAYLNIEYVREVEIDIDQLFVLENVTQRVKDAQVLVNNFIQQQETVLLQTKCPSIKVSEACFKPYKCLFYNYCFSELPPLTVFNISRLRKSKAARMIEDGIIEPSQMPTNTKLSIEQWVEVQAAKSGKAIVKKKEIESFLTDLKLEGPTLWMDFESMMSPIPELLNTRPYQQICFQYCVLLRDEKGNITRREYLAERGVDPRKQFLEKLIEDTKGNAPIIVYNQAFEVARLRELSRLFGAEYAEEIEDMISRIKDLLIPFAKRHYYHPSMRGSASIKSVLNCLVPEDELSYSNISIKNGAIAMTRYEKLHTYSLREQIEIKHALLEYCSVDCMSMVKLAEALQKLVI